MGEHGAATLPPAPAAAPRLPRAPLLALALGLALLLGLATVPQPRLDGEGAGALLLARSLANDGDRLWEVADRARAEGLVDSGQVAREAVLGAEDYGKAFSAPLAYGLFLAPWAALAGARGALLAQGLLLALATLFAAATLARRSGPRAAWLPLLLLFASSSGAYALRLWPEATLASALLLAFALARAAHPPLPVEIAAGDLPDLYPLPPEERATPGGRYVPRWLLVGGLLGAVGSAAPWTLPLLWPACATVPAPRRRAGVTLVLLAAATVLLALALTGAATAGTPPSPRSLLDAIGPTGPATLHPRVLGWDLLHVLAGRHLGLLFYFAPLLLLASLSLRGEGRGALWGGAALALLLLLLWRPFDLSGAPLAIGLRPLVPLAAALTMAVARPPRRLALLLVCVWAAGWLWPLWRAPRQPFGDAAEARFTAPYLAPWAPLETTQTSLRFGSSMPFGGAGGRLTVLGGEVLAGGHVVAVPAGSWVELLAGMPDALPGLWVEGGEQAGNDLLVRGGEVSETVLRPDGGIAFLVRPKRVYAHHAMPGSSHTWSFYHLSVRLPGPAGRPFTVRIRPG